MQQIGELLARALRHRDDESHSPGHNIPTQDFIEIWEFRPDFVTPANSTFTGPFNVAVSEFDSIDDALKMANESIYGLSSAIYTTDLRTARRYIDGIEAGLAHVNVHTGYKEPSMPFGQTGNSMPRW